MKQLTAPNPILNANEKRRMTSLQKKYDKMREPSVIVKTGKNLGSKIGEIIPEEVKDLGVTAVDSLTEMDFYKKAIEYAVSGFSELEKLAARITINEINAVDSINKTIENQDITSVEEICFARANDIGKVVNKYRSGHILSATMEGAVTGYFGFAGLIPNFVASMFLYFRAVQSVAMLYGYDIKNNASEMEIASSVAIAAFDPSTDSMNNELTATISKFMVLSEASGVKQASTKTWSAMIEHGGLGLLITQVRALSNKAAKSALEKAGQKGLEQSAFKSILEQLGRKATLKNTGKAVPYLGALFGALFDTAQMKKIIDYADVFYGKRFIEEKEVRINEILHPDLDDREIIDVDALSAN